VPAADHQHPAKFFNERWSEHLTMANDSEVKVRITADTTGVKAGLSDARNEVQSIGPALQQMNGQFAKINSATARSSENMGAVLKGVSVATQQANKGAADLAVQTIEVAKQFSAGSARLEIFASHATQVVAAISEAAGISEGSIGFMTSPWGAAIILANKAMLDPLIAGTTRYDNALSALRKQYEAGRIDAKAFGDQEMVLERQLKNAQVTLPPPHPPQVTRTSASPPSASPSPKAAIVPQGPEAPFHISGNFSQPLELSPGSRDKFVADIKNTFQNVG
jgi:hypothetical protein